jgi:hypothetical protein
MEVGPAARFILHRVLHAVIAAGESFSGEGGRFATALAFSSIANHMIDLGFSDYIVYVDESGDHGMANNDPTYPIFVLAFCVMHKGEYIEQIVPRLQRLKYKHWGHDMVVLHEHEIRKATGDFTFLHDRARRDEFMQDINDLVDQSPFTVIAGVVRKDNLSKQQRPPNPYHLALCFGLEQIDRFLTRKGELNCQVHVVFEARGKKEDEELELEFRRVCDGNNCRKEKFRFDFILAHKRVNSCGLQFADLIARPIGLYVLRPSQRNRAFELIEPKLDRDSDGEVIGAGLQCFPQEAK